MISFVKLIRPSVVLLTALGVFVGAFLSNFSNSSSILLAILSASLIAGGGNALNDYFDYKTDRIKKPHRPIPSGKAKREDVLVFSLVLLIVGFILSFLLTTLNIILSLINIFVILAYNSVIKRVPLLGNFCPSWLAASSFVYGGLLSLTINPSIILLFSMAFLGNTAREIAKSVEDVAGDARSGFKTLPVVAGKSFSILIAATFILLAIAFSPLPYLFNLLSEYYLVFVVISDLLFILSLFHFLTSAEKAQRYMKRAMFVAIFAFFIGAI